MKNIKVINLCKNYNNNEVFKNFNCTFKKNQFNSLMGKSGIGKTTLLYILMGLDNEYTGQIIGLENKKISVLFQENRLLEEYTILENINFVQKEPINLNILNKSLKDIGLSNLKHKKISELSGGMKRRVAILRTILYDADVYYLDEPFKNLDDETHKKLLNFIKIKLKNKTVIFSSHYPIDSDYLNANIISIY